MLIFIDDSGDAGFKLEKGSSEFFIICSVIFDDELEAEKTALAIKELRRQLKFSDNVEFKFNGSRKKVIIAFLKTVSKHEFRIRALVVDKKKIRSDELRNNKDSFYSYFIKLLLKHNKGTIKNACVKIDGSGDRIFRRSFLTYLRSQLNGKEQKVMKNCRLVNSKSNVLIQLADMIAGTIRRSYDESKTDRKLYKEIIKNRIEDEWQFK